jgi:lipoprotein-anchoring transpeptidase ErfK/SrfK
MRLGLRRIAVVAVAGAVAAVAAGCGSSSPTPRAVPARHVIHRVADPPAVATTTTTTTPTPVSTVVATTDGAIPGSAAPGAAPDMTVPGSWFGYPSILPVIATAPGWLEVRLAQRPNGSTTWVEQSDVSLGSTPYAIVINLATMHLTVSEDGTQILDFPAGIGAPDDPTPPGHYFVTMQYPPPSAGYGPFVLVTSDHSDSITDWEDSGDAIIGIHGPITSYDDSLIGTTGAAISHGCVRLHDADLAQLSVIPPGTPIDIIN